MTLRGLNVGMAAALAVLLGLCGCKDKPKYPTAKAPPTLKNINRPAADDEGDDGEDDIDEGGDETPTARGSVSGPRHSTRPGAKKGLTVFAAKGAKTINGHAKGPKAEVFNAVLNSVFPRVSDCFQSQLDKLPGERPSIRIRVRIANTGKVSEATVVGGTDNASVRSCTVTALKSLKFPAYQGRPISQVVPFTLIKNK